MRATRWMRPSVATLASVSLMAVAAGCSGGGKHHSFVSSSSSASVSPAIVGSTGGKVTGDATVPSAQVVIAPGALTQPTTISVTAGSEVTSAGFQSVGLPVQFGPSGTTFAVPVTVTVPVGTLPSGFTLNDVVVLHRDEGTGVVTVLTPIQVDASASTVTVQAASFSTYEPEIHAPAKAEDSTITAAPALILADGVATSTITVKLETASESVPAPTMVSLAVSGSGNTVTPMVATSDMSGLAVFTVSSTFGETKTVTATVTPDGPPSFTLTTTIVFVKPSPPPPPPPPTISLTVTPAKLSAIVDVPTSLTVAATSSSTIDLVLLNQPPGAVVFEPTKGAASPVTRTFRWIPPSGAAGAGATTAGDYVLRFQATIAGVATATVNVPVQVSGAELGAIVHGDVTGDGIPDVIAIAQLAKIGGVTQAGAIYVWKGGSAITGAPSFTLTVPGAVSGDRLGGASSALTTTLQLADVTGDGVLDIIALATDATVGGTSKAGAVYIWKGGATISSAPDFTLTVPGAVSGDALGTLGPHGQGVQVADVTGDGIPDIIVGASNATVGGATKAGAIYVWKGGATISSAPDFTLTVPGASAYDALGTVAVQGQGVQLADLTGDGVLDIIGSTPYATVGGVVSVGAIYVWKGGATISSAPDFTLTVPGAVSGDELGSSSGQGVLLADVTGDGVLDIVAGAPTATVGGVSQVGAIYVWKGGSSISASPDFTLTVPGAVANDLLGYIAGQGVQVFDVTGDGVPDIVAGCENATVGGVAKAGAIYVWKGGSSISASPDFTLSVPGATSNDQLGYNSGQGIQIADVTGDGVPDIVAGAYKAKVGSVTQAGAIYVWKGGATISSAPSFTLTVPGAVTSDMLGFCAGDGQGVQLADLTGDGILDIVGVANFADVGGVTDTGALYVWKGGSTIAAAPSFTLTVPGASSGDNLGRAGSGQGVLLADVTGDGVLDIVASSPYAKVGSATNAGTVYVWVGGSTITAAPSFTLTVPGAVSGDELTTASGQGLQLADVTGDGLLDIIVCAQTATVGGVANAGAIHIWKGGATLTASPSFTLTVPGAVTGDTLCAGSGQGVMIGDVTGDGIPDVIGVAFYADVGGVTDTGALYVWKGGATIAGAPSATLTVPGASSGDQLGY